MVDERSRARHAQVGAALLHTHKTCHTYTSRR
jgi:hypothetical protein